MSKDVKPLDITLTLDEDKETLKQIITRQKRTLTVCIVILIVVLILNSTIILLRDKVVVTEQVGLVALLDVENGIPDIPDYDPTQITPPDDDTVQKLNEKLDKGKMCINMASSVIFENSYSSGKFNIYNDEANNFPQFVTITLDSNGTTIYQSGLLDVGKCIIYAPLEVVLPKGTYDCTATFSQVDNGTICGQAAAKVVITVLN